MHSHCSVYRVTLRYYYCDAKSPRAIVVTHGKTIANKPPCSTYWNYNSTGAALKTNPWQKKNRMSRPSSPVHRTTPTSTAHVKKQKPTIVWFWMIHVPKNTTASTYVMAITASPLTNKSANHEKHLPTKRLWCVRPSPLPPQPRPQTHPQLLRSLGETWWRARYARHATCHRSMPIAPSVLENNKQIRVNKADFCLAPWRRVLLQPTVFST